MDPRIAQFRRTADADAARDDFPDLSTASVRFSASKASGNTSYRGSAAREPTGAPRAAPRSPDGAAAAARDSPRSTLKTVSTEPFMSLYDFFWAVDASFVEAILDAAREPAVDVTPLRTTGGLARVYCDARAHSFVCPVCNRVQHVATAELVEAHIDACLACGPPPEERPSPSELRTAVALLFAHAHTAPDAETSIAFTSDGVPRPGDRDALLERLIEGRLRFSDAGQRTHGTEPTPAMRYEAVPGRTSGTGPIPTLRFVWSTSSRSAMAGPSPLYVPPRVSSSLDALPCTCGGTAAGGGHSRACSQAMYRKVHERTRELRASIAAAVDRCARSADTGGRHAGGIAAHYRAELQGLREQLRAAEETAGYVLLLAGNRGAASALLATPDDRSADSLIGSDGVMCVDLHGQHADAAATLVENELVPAAKRGGAHTLKLITGVGRHSGKDGATMKRRVRQCLQELTSAGRIVSFDRLPADEGFAARLR